MLMEGKRANLVLTDPPYNVNVEETAGKIKNDNMPCRIPRWLSVCDLNAIGETRPFSSRTDTARAAIGKGSGPEPGRSSSRYSSRKGRTRHFYNFLFCAFVNMEQNMEKDASIYVFHADTQGLTFRRAIHELLVQLHPIADAPGFLAGDQRGAGAKEGVEDDAVGHGGVFDGVGHQSNGFHGGMVLAGLGPVVFPDGCLFAI